MGNVGETSDNSFSSDVTAAKGLVLVDFFAPWCAPCKMLAPILDEVSKEFDDVKFYKLNIDDNPHSSQALGISGVPTLVLFRDGKPVASEVGALNRDALRNFIKEALS